jgi:protein-tyrosine phosphatase
MKVLMVCLGNICRSPLAQGILERKVQERGLDWTVDSAGTGHWHVGNPPDPRSVAVAAAHGLDLSAQRARQVHWPDLGTFDLVLDYVAPGEDLSVPDPYWDDDGFERVYRMLDEACGRLLDAHAPAG